MKAICPANPQHKEFTTVAHVLQEWLVDERGNFKSCLHEGLEVTHKPDPGNIWICAECDAEAQVEA